MTAVIPGIDFKIKGAWQSECRVSSALKWKGA